MNHPEDKRITSLSNPRLKQVVALRRRRVRDQLGLTVIEGRDEVAVAVRAGVPVDTLMTCTELLPADEDAHALVEKVRELGGEIVELSRDAFSKIAYRQGPDGVLGIVRSVNPELHAVPLPDDPLVLLCEGLEKPGNVGAILRTADAAGVDAVIAIDPGTDWGNPNVVRSSKGALFAVPVASATLEEALSWLSARGIRLIATTPETPTLHTQISYAGGVAIAIGSEKWGLTERALAAADERVRIEQRGVVNSLNASVSAAVVTYEAVRQRG